MLIRGMSYPKGIFYMDNEYIAHATMDSKKNIHTKLYPFNLTGLLFFAKSIILSFPWYYFLAMIIIIAWILQRPDFPFFALLLALFGYHFFFPYKLKQYHGAEHQIFSHAGTKSIDCLDEIAQASIVNRNCSTNHVVIFYVLFLLAYFPWGGNIAALIALLGNILIPKFLQPIDEKVFFPISSYLQVHCTTAEPSRNHLMVALLGFLTLIRREEITEESLLTEKAEAQQRLLDVERDRIIAETQWLEI